MKDFTVEGRGEFPFDMLRHDECWPVEDTFQMSRTDRRRVKLRTHSDRYSSPPTVARWASFGWIVVAINGEELMA